MKFGKIIGTVALLVGLYFLWRLRFVALLGFTAVALATLLNRVVRRLTEWRLPRGWAILVTLMLFLGIGAAIAAIVIPPFVAQVNEWLTQLPQETAKINSWLLQVSDRLPPEVYLQLQKLDALIQDIPQIARGVFSNIFIFMRGALALSLNALFVLVITIMLLSNPKAYRKAFVSSFPQFYRR